MNDKLDLTTTEKMEHPRLPTATEGAAAVISSKEGCNNRSGNRQSNNHSAEPMKCPRCDSANTKFCYYNNYSLSQPRYFCKACRRYWTQGGTLRNVPVGGGCRKTKRVKTFRPSSAMDGFNPSCNPMQFINSHLDSIGGGFLNGLQHPSLPLMLHGFPPLPYPSSSDIINENHHLQRFGLALSHMQEDEESMRSENTPSLISPYDIAGSSIAGITDHSDPSLLHSQNSLLHHDLSTTLDQTSLLKQLSNYSSCPPDLSLLFENTTNSNNTVAVEDDQHQNHHFRAFSSANLGLSSSFQAGLETQLQLQQPKQGFQLMDHHHHHHHHHQQQYQHKGGERDGQLLSEERVQEHLERLKAKALLSHITNQQSSSSSNNNNNNNNNINNNNINNTIINNNNNNNNNTTGEPTHWVPQVMLQNGVSTNQIRAEQSWPTPWQTPNYN